ncbi:transposase [Streptomyces sp. NPDC056821]|uniref:transposase n=1 Tax=unclassified Streptomyces TaxID=2593676 RepID=UPI00367D2360
MDTPGIGPVLAGRLLARTGRPDRFPTAAAYASYCGTAPAWPPGRHRDGVSGSSGPDGGRCRRTRLVPPRRVGLPWSGSWAGPFSRTAGWRRPSASISRSRAQASSAFTQPTRPGGRGRVLGF